MTAIAAALNARVTEINLWRTVRGDPAVDLAWARDSWRQIPIVTPAPVPRVNLIPSVRLPITKYAANPYAPSAAGIAWLAINPAGLPGGSVNWVGKKILYEGGSRNLGLWEWAPAPGVMVVAPRVKNLVVKEDIRPSYVLRNEYRIHQILKSAGKHIVKAIGAPEKWPDNTLAEECHKKIFLEYCSGGDLFDLLGMRTRTGRYFNELTIWKFFECLVDGVCAMTCGKELITTGDPTDANGGYVLPPGGEWTNVTHFDMKPENIFLATGDAQHSSVPLLKTADFGHSEVITKAVNDDKSQNGKNRKEETRKDRGTPDYFNPEFFHADWEAANWEASDIAGNYQPSTFNLWGVGMIMYQIVLISLDPPDIKVPFLPNHTINNAPPKGRTFGIDLHAYRTKYSRALTDLIYECLYENPKHRPELHALKHKITSAYQEALDAGAELEEKRHFEPAPAPPPPPPPAPPLPPLPALPVAALPVLVLIPPLVAARKRKRGNSFYVPGERGYRCQGILDNGFQCRNKLQAPIGALNPRCKRCTDAGR